MSGRFDGLRTLVQGVVVNAKWAHCLIQREALASQQFSGYLNGVLKAVVKTVNFIKARPLKVQLFQRLCDELGAKHNNSLFYNENNVPPAQLQKTPLNRKCIGTAASIPLRFSGVFCSCAGGTLFSLYYLPSVQVHNWVFEV